MPRGCLNSAAQKEILGEANLLEEAVLMERRDGRPDERCGKTK